MEPSALVYDTAAAAEVWRRVAPAIPAYGAGVCPAGATCPLPRRETDGEAALGSLIADGAALYITLLGAFLFLSIWETRGRYFFQFEMVLLAAAALLRTRQPSPTPSAAR